MITMFKTYTNINSLELKLVKTSPQGAMARITQRNCVTLFSLLSIKKSGGVH